MPVAAKRMSTGSAKRVPKPRAKNLSPRLRVFLDWLYGQLRNEMAAT